MRRFNHSKTSAFSLIELLVVCAVIALVAGFAVPAATTMIRGSQLSQGAQLLTDQMALARQTALTRNRQVEVRFYRYSDPETPGEDASNPEDGKFRAFQLFDVADNGAIIPLGKFTRLPSTVVMNKGGISSLIRDLPLKDAERQKGDVELPPLPKAGEGRWKYQYVSFRYRPDGSTDLMITGSNQGNWFVTIHGIEAPEETENPPTNFFTLQVDPVSGSTRSYRPNAG